ncbi:hypothetical protein H103_04160 [Trichophyton rubrum CBS 288.86]|uniref:Uncharacterized protein n=2 Tax=Trichophyton TaxID=5550 RepID=A0A022W3Q9_TRIRU|nr:hypothetical protein H103_04160 [Trichophyton rubrum CBS 288.86]EZF74055.1 hypothetical protein H105_04177 [Trichophyton soudanense CBS 452.61]KMQ46704.1 hypothetical protein HL42_2599 [Trichophyton rubrum]
MPSERREKGTEETDEEGQDGSSVRVELDLAACQIAAVLRGWLFLWHSFFSLCSMAAQGLLAGLQDKADRQPLFDGKGLFWPVIGEGSGIRNRRTPSSQADTPIESPAEG